MGREIRRVPPNWQHPKDYKGDYVAVYDRNYLASLTEWITNHIWWESGGHPDKEGANCRYYEEWFGPPPRLEYCRTYTDDEATWFQLYETVSEGTPLSPPFASEEELIEWLSTNADAWGNRRTREQAEDMVRGGHAPSMAVSGGKLITAEEAPTFMKGLDEKEVAE